MFAEYDWTFGVYRIRFGQVWTSFRGVSSWDSLKDLKADLELWGCKLGKKTDSRTWPIESTTCPNCEGGGCSSCLLD